MLQRSCPDCEGTGIPVSRREFVRVIGGAAAAAVTGPLASRLAAQERAPAPPESLVKLLYDSLTAKQREEICFDWDHTDDRGLLRTHVSNNWHVTDAAALNVAGPFFTSDQRELIRRIFFGLYNPDWHERITRQLHDDTGGKPWGQEQSIALFGAPGSGQFEFVMTGRHLTIRCDGDSAEHVAFGGPIFYGHAASGFDEKPGHPGNVFWPQAQQANKLFQMLDGRQRAQALVATAPHESRVGFQGREGKFAGIPVADLSADQKAHARKVLETLLEPYRTADRSEASTLLDRQGGLDACRLAFFRQDGEGKSVDLGDDGEWDVWRLEGPAFVWHFRGVPHVHVWVNVADDPSVPLNARG